MIIFINDIPLRILKADELPEPGSYNLTIDAATEPITQSKLIHHVWIKSVNEMELEMVLKFLNSKVPINVLSISLSVLDYAAIQVYFKSKFKVVKAAGGLIRKKEKFLMIYRMKKWDLPKGKKEKRERYKETAVREVGEECNVTVKLGGKICTTWHTYTMNKRSMLKKTRWYLMDVVDDSRMRPDLAEDIEDVRWMSQKEVYHALELSYRSIRHVFERYYALTEIRSPR